ncbi:copper homeostasis protein CutC [Pleomorphovibrio marinus]|uniref:copper homeostasis protein CutC n=1 Tax=Pleomorphovibrio marinus TaxID=2164132 RepID=UPI000E0C5391|nr:copper homeostasis protein CutC [Pleomorphovibrio marinus]
MSRKIIMETPVYTAEAAIAAQEAGVDRIELCADYGEGGTTPSLGLLTVLKKTLHIPIFVMVRPRGGDFIYSELELRVMKEDLTLMKEKGADGFVFGVLNRDGRVNMEVCKELVGLAAPLPCTFHRAIDVSLDIEEALEQVITCGFKRILSSGGKQTVGEGITKLLSMYERAADRILIMPGGGMEPKWIPVFLEKGNLREFHASCKSCRPSSSDFIHPEVRLSTSGEFVPQIWTVDKQKVHAFKHALYQ